MKSVRTIYFVGKGKGQEQIIYVRGNSREVIMSLLYLLI